MSLLPPPEKPKPTSGAGAPSSASGGAAPKPSAASAASKAEAVASNMLSSLRVSLMPSDLEGRPAPNLAKGLIILAAVLAVETVAIGVLYFMTGREVSGTIAQRDQMQADIQRIDKETATLEAAAVPAVTYAYQVRAAKETLGKHVYWSPFFAFLEKSTLPTVKYLTFSGDATTNVIALDCFAGTYRDVAQQIVSLRELPMVLDVRSNSAVAKIDDKGEITGISFSMVIKVKPEAWSLMTAPSAMMPDAQPSSQNSGASVPASSESGSQAPAFIAAPDQTAGGSGSSGTVQPAVPNGAPSTQPVSPPPTAPAAPLPPQ